MARLTVALLAGGASSEREVSLKGGDQVYQALDKKRFRVKRYDPRTDLPRLVADAPGIDVALVILHGAHGEDGTVQGLLDLLHIPYQGSGVLGSALSMNKLATKQIYESVGLPVPPYVALKEGDPVDGAALVRRFGLPLVVKPARGGSSIGVSIVQAEPEVATAVEDALALDDTVLVETYIQGREITGAVLGNRDLTPLPIVEIIPADHHPFFNYQAKYTAGETREVCPAPMEAALAEKAQAYAVAAHQALFCRGYSRTDMILKGRDIYVLETNTIPGMTPTSLLPLAARAAGIEFGPLIEKLIDLALETQTATPLGQ